MSCTALILAAGFGSRLMPLTAQRPKALVEVAGRPLLARLVEDCAAAGCDDVVIVTGFKHEVVDGWLVDEDLPLPARTVFNEAFDRYGNACRGTRAQEKTDSSCFAIATTPPAS